MCSLWMINSRLSKDINVVRVTQKVGKDIAMNIAIIKIIIQKIHDYIGKGQTPSKKTTRNKRSSTIKMQYILRFRGKDYNKK